MNYTKRDHDTFRVLDAHSEDGKVVLPNRILAKELGISPGAAVPRLDRLRDLGVIRVDYEINSYNGNVKRRTIVLLTRPQEPYQKPAKSATPEAPPETPPEDRHSETELADMDAEAAELTYEGSNVVTGPDVTDW